VARRTDHSSANFLFSSARQWLAGRIGHRLTSSFLPLISCLPGLPDRVLIGLLSRSFCLSVACPACQTDRSSAYFLVPSAHQCLAWLAGRSTHRLTSSFLLLVSGLPDGLPDGSLISLLPCSFRSSVAHQTDRTSAYLVVPSAHQWLARRLARRITLRLTSSFFPLISGLPDGLPGGSLFGFLPRSFRSSVACSARRTDCSSAYFLVSSTRLWLARRIGHRLTSSFLPLISGLTVGSSDGSLVGLLPRFFLSSVARRIDHSSAYILVPSAHQWLAGQLAVRIALRLPSSFLPLISGLPDGLPGGSLFGFLPHSFRSSVACSARLTDFSSAYFLVSSARLWLDGWIGHRLTSSFLPLISGLPGSPDGALIGLLPPSAHQWLAGRIAHWLTSLFLPLVSGFPDGFSDGLLIGLLPCSFRSSVAFPTAPRTDCSSAYFLVLPLINGLPDRSLVGLLPRSFRSSMACLTARQMDRSSAYFLLPSGHQWLA